MHGPEVFEMFKERGYAIAELNNVLYRKLDPDETVSAASRQAARFGAATSEEAEVTGAIVESAFFPDGAPEAFRGLIAPLYQMEQALAFVAESRRQAGGVRHGAGDSRAQSLCAVRRRDARRVSRTRPANGSAARPHVGGSNGRMRIRRGGDTRAARPRNATSSAWAFALPTARSR